LFLPDTMKTLLTISAVTAFAVSAFAQDKAADPDNTKGYGSEGMIVHAAVYNGDTIPWVGIPEVNIYGERNFKNLKEKQKWDKLKRDVKRVYPYAILAAAKLKEYDRAMEKMPLEAQRKIYMKKAEEELKNQFEDELKKLTMNQGRILIKLIDRETGNTSYNLVKDLRGSFQAFMWQSVARIFGSNLKSEYDANGDDKAIENVIHLIEAGEI
jgi:hypothetical protein